MLPKIPVKLFMRDKNGRLIQIKDDTKVSHLDSGHKPLNIAALKFKTLAAGWAKRGGDTMSRPHSQTADQDT